MSNLLNLSSPSMLPQPTQHASHPDVTLAELRPYAFSLGLAVGSWNHEPAWVTLRHMALIVALDSSEYPFKKPDMKQLSFLYGLLAKAIEASNLRETRSTLNDMLRAAYLA